MMDEERALQVVDEQLDAALSGIAAPPGFASAVLSRTRHRRLSPVPELLDLIGFMAILAILFVLLIPFAALIQNVRWLAALVGIVGIPVLYFGVTSARDVGAP